MPSERMTVLFRMNGVCNAFMREYGCRCCPQCTPAKPRAHTSGSLIVKSGWGTCRAQEHHLLFDIGIGVIDSLMEFDAPFVTHLFLSHNHWDHIAEIDPLVNTQKRSGGPPKPPVYCTEGTRKTGPEGRFPWLDLDYRKVESHRPIELDLGIGLKVTPVAVYHGPTAFEPVNWVLEWTDKEREIKRKLVLAWDFLHLVPCYPLEDRDGKYSGASAQQNTLLPEHSELLRGADVLIMEGNTLSPQPDTGHTSIEALLKFHIPVFGAKDNAIVHYSGHEDSFGPLSDEAVDDWLTRNKGDYGLEGIHLRLARHGQLWTF